VASFLWIESNEAEWEESIEKVEYEKLDGCRIIEVMLIFEVHVRNKLG